MEQPAPVVPDVGGGTGPGPQALELQLDPRRLLPFSIGVVFAFVVSTSGVRWLIGPLFGRAWFPARVDVSTLLGLVLGSVLGGVLFWVLGRGRCRGRLVLEAGELRLERADRGRPGQQLWWAEATSPFRLRPWPAGALSMHARTTLPDGQESSWPVYVRGLSRQEVVALLNRHRSA